MRLTGSLFSSILLLAALNMACEQDSVKKSGPNGMNNAQDFKSNFRDPHSAARPADAVTQHLDLDISVDFEQKRIQGTADYTIRLKEGVQQIYFDTRNLDILKVTDGRDTLPYSFGAENIHLGKALEVKLPAGATHVVLTFATQPGAEALQWLEPSQTAGKTKPFLFTQAQAILARTWLPCQDSPGIRFTYKAKVKVPVGLLAVMSATNPTSPSPDGSYSFEMKQPIPAYLIALAVGDLKYKGIGARTGVYAEPSMVDKSASEFIDMDKMLVAAEDLYGPYAWERYDVIVLPPSFPFGGMENPRLTFATPTILAGDRSLTSLVAHELAHSWSGNLVTNATWNDFWLNEGFTVYFERRIMEKLYGKPYADMLAILGYQDLQVTLADLGPSSRATCLKLSLDNQNPDDGMNDVAYEKGYLLLLLIEEAVGRERFDAFLKKYFDQNAFSTMTTEGFVEYLERELIKGDQALAAQLDLKTWIYSPGLPATHTVPKSARFEAVDAQLTAWEGGAAPKSLAGTSDWSTHEWLHFIRHLPLDIATTKMTALDQAFGFTQSGNAEIQAAWFEHVIRRGYAGGYKALENFLVLVGRRKFVRPLFKLLAETPEGKVMAKGIYAKARPNYHSVTRGTVDEILGMQ